jgi:hypothetical protein
MFWAFGAETIPAEFKDNYAAIEAGLIHGLSAAVRSKLWAAGVTRRSRQKIAAGR